MNTQPVDIIGVRNMVMKDKVKAVLIILCITCESVCGCSSKIDTDSILDVSDSFLDAVLEINPRKILKLAVEDDSDSSYFDDEKFTSEHSATDSILENTVYEADESSIKLTKNNTKCTVDYDISMPDPSDVVEICNNDWVSVEKAIDGADEYEFTVTVELKLEDDEWLIADFEDVCDDIYEDVFDLPFTESLPSDTEETEVSEQTEPQVTEPEPEVTEPSESTDTSAETTVPVDRTELTMDDLNNATWDSLMVYFDGQIMSLPFDYELISNRWIILDERLDGYVLNRGDFRSVALELFGSKETGMNVSIANLYTDGIIDIKSGECVRLAYNQYSDGVDLSDFVLPGGVTYGMTVDEVIAVYGEPDKQYDPSESGYFSITYGDYQSVNLKLNFTLEKGLYGFEYDVSNEFPIDYKQN